LVGKKSKIIVKIRNIVSLDKTKYSFLPTKGHSIEITLNNDNVTNLKLNINSKDLIFTIKPIIFSTGLSL
jgi:hypothetical protein